MLTIRTHTNLIFILIRHNDFLSIYAKLYLKDKTGDSMKLELQKSFNVLLIVIALGAIYYFIAPHVAGLLKITIIVLFIVIALYSLTTIFKREYDE